MELVSALRTLAASGQMRWKGQAPFAIFFADYLEKLIISQDYNIDAYLPQLAVDAFEELRSGESQSTVGYRDRYEEETGNEVPNITELGLSRLLDQSSAVQTLGFMLSSVTSNQYIEKEIDAYCNAQKHAVQLSFDKFLREVYRKGLYEIINRSKSCGMRGMFGETELRSFVTAGRLILTFARNLGKGGGGNSEIDVSFVAADDDPLALSAGIQSIHSDFPAALDMIEDAIIYWPMERIKQNRIFRASKNIALA